MTYVGEITTLAVAATKKASLRTTVPMSIVRQFDLKAGDKLDWSFEVMGGELAIVVRATKVSRRSD